jgi:hypothetical protein
MDKYEGILMKLFIFYGNLLSLMEILGDYNQMIISMEMSIQMVNTTSYLIIPL